MFDIDTKMKGLLAVAVVGTALVAAAPASAATDIYLKTDGIYNPGTVHIYSPGAASVAIAENVYSGPLYFTGALGTGPLGPEFDFLGFCVDIYHNISAGVNGQAGLNLQYHEGNLKYDGDGNALSPTALSKIANLVTIGTQIWNVGGYGPHALSGTASGQLAGIQEAIWQIEGASTGGGSSYTSSYYALSAPTNPGAIKVVYNYDPSLRANATIGRNQGFAFAAGVPEPASWALMIMGFGGIGAAIRRRRSAGAPAA